MTALRTTPVALTSNAAPFAIRAERASDVVAREALLDACFGEGRQKRTCQRLRDGRAPAEGLALSAGREGHLVGTLRFWHGSGGGGLGARRRGRKAGADARAARSRRRLPQVRRRRGLDGRSAFDRKSARPWCGDPAGGCALLCPLRLLGGKDRRIAAAGPVRARAAARA